MTLVVYSVLGVGLFLKVGFGPEIPSNLFATRVRDYGFLLLLIPAVWSIWATWTSHQPATDHIALIKLYDSGLTVAFILGVIAFFATMSATAPLTRLMHVVEPTPKPLQSAHRVVVD